MRTLKGPWSHGTLVRCADPLQDSRSATGCCSKGIKDQEFGVNQSFYDTPTLFGFEEILAISCSSIFASKRINA
ncbi:hypothetical protein NECAME_00451 [Necator americanus]|uniref:Uncharacterized protein n=1 Tax=Necator americanus TaxID=51031 RepID=W2T6Y6_NECAM|nr:hypothetical protein NECAME_00451 [Necator americanus]ETN76926.1 hypothetical protein NECAME_00451 [Necator americanus]